MKLMGRTQPLDDYPVLEALEVVKRLGFEGVEICLENEDVSPETLTPARITEIRAKVRALELAPYSISYHKDYLYDDVLFERTKMAIRMTPAFGTPLFVFSGPAERPDDPGAWDRLVARTRTLAELAEASGVILAEEFEPGFVVGSTADLLRLFEAIPFPALAANLDLGHVFLCDPDPLDAIRQVGEKVVHCHVENMETGVHDHKLPQEGDMDLAAYIRTLDEIGYDGGLSLDLYGYDYEAVAPDAIAYLRGLLP